MPRKRQGPPGTQGLRTDTATKTQPVVAPTGMAYGEHQASVQAQQAVPLPLVGGAPTTPVTPGAPPLDMAAAIQAAKDHMVTPGNFGGPTQQPDVPLTAGSPSGPGPGAAALNLPSPVENLAQLLQGMANSPQSNPDVQFLARSVAGGRM